MSVVQKLASAVSPTVARPVPNQTFADEATVAAEYQKLPSTVKGYRSWVAACILLLIFLTIQFFLPLRTAVKIGADEDYELSKITLSLKGYKFYSEVWNDQPLLHTFIVTKVVKNLSSSVLAARLVTSVLSAVLLASLFLMAFRVSGLLVATLTTALVIASPGFVELSGSCMVEIPALAPGLVALAVLVTGPPSKWRSIVAAVLFAVALQIKFIAAILLPLAALIIWLEHRKSGSPSKSLIYSAVLFAASLAVSFIAIGVLVGEGSYWLQLKQAWAAHFAPTRSFEYGSPADHPFDWSILLKNWDATVPAMVGIIVCASQRRRNELAIIPVAWLVLEFVVFGTHKPWWSYYYIHNAIPLCWCAAIGIAAVVYRLQRQRNVAFAILCSLFMLVAGTWAVGRVYLQVSSIRASPKLYSSLVLKEIKRFEPFTKFIYTDEPVYSFHSGIPLPPKLAIVSLKRLWSGDMTNARLVEELGATQPGLVLLGNSTRELPFGDWLAREYRLVYQDAKHRLYAHTSIVNRPD
jgi:hypothetical protein